MITLDGEGDRTSKMEKKQQLIMPWDSVTIWPDATDNVTSDDFRQKRLISRYFRQCIIHLKRQPAEKGKNNIRERCLIISVCTFRKREVLLKYPCGEGALQVNVSIKREDAAAQALQKLSSARTNTFPSSGLWNNKEKCVSLRSFVACWQ